MLIKTEEFVKKLKSKLYQYTFNKNKPLVLKGSFQQANFISDIDFTSFVSFDSSFITVLIDTLQHLRDFKFIYLNAGMDRDFKVPWTIYPEWGCEFDIDKVYLWYTTFKTLQLLPESCYANIEKILYQENLVMSDLIHIQEILHTYKTVKWFLPDIIKGTKTVREHTYILLDELKLEDGAVLNSIYIDNDKIVSVDIGLVDKKYRHVIWSRMYKYYTQHWYKILKHYKKLIRKQDEQEYRYIMSTLEYDNALLARINLVKTLLKYNTVSQSTIQHIQDDLEKELKSAKIVITNLDEVTLFLENKLNDASKPFVDYLFDKLSYSHKIQSLERTRLTQLSSTAVSVKTLQDRKKAGIDCPFFDSDDIQILQNLSANLLIDEKKFKECIESANKTLKKPLGIFFRDVFYTFPLSRLFLQYKNNLLYIRGSFTNTDYLFLNNFCLEEIGYFSCDIKYTNRVRLYLICGK